jgi:HD-like signal output (HDOD) protein
MASSGHQQIPKEYQGMIAEGKDWREVVAWVSDLPPMPQVASRAIQMVENPDTSASELTELLSSDTALAARVLKIANSAMFARQREISTLGQAIGVIGLKSLKGIIVGATLRQVSKSFGNLQKMVWENSMATAMNATRLSKHLKKPFVQEVFLLGLLHSLGQVVLLADDKTPEMFKELLKIIEARSVDWITAEHEVFGFGHPLIGALVGKKWNFSEDACQTILHSKDPLESLQRNSETDAKCGIVQLADLCTHLAEIGSPPGYPKDEAKITSLAVFLGFDKESALETIHSIAAETKEQFDAEGSVYS